MDASTILTPLVETFNTTAFDPFYSIEWDYFRSGAGICKLQLHCEEDDVFFKVSHPRNAPFRVSVQEMRLIFIAMNSPNLNQVTYTSHSGRNIICSLSEDAFRFAVKTRTNKIQVDGIFIRIEEFASIRRRLEQLLKYVSHV